MQTMVKKELGEEIESHGHSLVRWKKLCRDSGPFDDVNGNNRSCVVDARKLGMVFARKWTVDRRLVDPKLKVKVK